MCAAQNPPKLDRASALFVDLDGTLIELASRPELVRIPSKLPALLARLDEALSGALAVVSGRPLKELDRLLEPWKGAAAGVHGSERRRTEGTLERAKGGRSARALARLRPRLEAFAARDPGLFVEDKETALALHYRAAPRLESEICAWARRLSRKSAASLRVIEGDRVVEFAAPFPHKGSAIEAFLAEPPFRGRLPVFLGDDESDEDGFAAVNRLRGISIRVGPLAETRAPFALPSVAAALLWLEALF